MAAQYKLKFCLKERDGKGYIRVRVSYFGKYIDILTGYCVSPDMWNDEMQRVRPKGNEDRYVNAKLGEIENAVSEVFGKSMYTYGDMPSAQSVKDAIHKVTGRCSEEKSDPKLVSNVILDFIKEQSETKEWAWPTVQKFVTMRNHMKAFNPKLKLSDFRNDDTLRRFSDFLLKTGLRNVTVRKDMKLVCWFLRWAERKSLVSEVVYPDIKYKGTDEGFRNIVFLRPEELICLHNYDFAVDSLARVRDVFCFCCFTGLRYSDVAKLSTSDISGDSITVVTQKTNDRLVVELNRYSKEILQRYGSLGCEDRSLPALPVISNQRMNTYLKEAGRP